MKINLDPDIESEWFWYKEHNILFRIFAIIFAWIVFSFVISYIELIKIFTRNDYCCCYCNQNKERR